MTQERTHESFGYKDPTPIGIALWGLGFTIFSLFFGDNLKDVRDAVGTMGLGAIVLGFPISCVLYVLRSRANNRAMTHYLAWQRDADKARDAEKAST